jgi:hypothetical protein
VLRKVNVEHLLKYQAHKNWSAIVLGNGMFSKPQVRKLKYFSLLECRTVLKASGYHREIMYKTHPKIKILGLQ